MNKADLSDLTQHCLPLIETVSVFIRSQKDKVVASDIRVKDANSLVTYVDQAAEQKLVEGLGKLLPEATFITDEDGNPEDV